MKFQTLRDAMRAAEIARAELENAMVKFEMAMAEMNKALDDATHDRPRVGPSDQQGQAGCGLGADGYRRSAVTST